MARVRCFRFLPYRGIENCQRKLVILSDALRESSEIVITGYSLVPADERAREMIFNAGNKNASIQVCCGADNVRLASELADALFTSVKAASRHFKEWLNSTCSPSERLTSDNEPTKVLHPNESRAS